MTARILDVTPGQYHRDPCSRPSLSSSIAHTLVTRSPLHAWTEHPRLGDQRKESTAAQSDGSIIHGLLLGKGSEIAVVHEDSFRSKAAREARDNALASGNIPVLADKYAQLALIAAELAAKLSDFGLDLDGESEVAIEFEQDGVLCRSMLDHVFWDAGIVVDVKTITSADAGTCSRHAWNYGYTIQHAAYTAAFEALRPEFAGRSELLFIFMELEPPYAVVPRKPDGVFAELGRQQWGRAVKLWKECLATGKWKSYADDIDVLYAPGWAMAQEEAENE